MASNYDDVDILALEAAAALKAGMSYGQWKAMGGKVEKVDQIPIGWKICKHCGTPFKPKHGVRQLYCDAVCQSDAQQERFREKKREYGKAYRARKKAMAAR